MNTFKLGDLVQIIKPSNCCGTIKHLGEIGQVGSPPTHTQAVICGRCGKLNYDIAAYCDVNGVPHHYTTLKKFDPPAEGETPGAYRNLKEPA